VSWERSVPSVGTESLLLGMLSFISLICVRGSASVLAATR